MFPTLDTLLNTDAILPLSGSLFICLALAAYQRWARKQEWPKIGKDFLALSSILGIIAITLFRNEGGPSFSPSGVLDWASGGTERFVSGIGSDSEITLNLLLFVPAGTILTLRYRQPPKAFVFLALLSLTIELTQGLLGLGNPDVSDLISNSVGTLLGISFASIALCFTKHRNAMLISTAAVTVGAMILAAATVVPLARLRQGNMEHELKERFNGTTIADYRRWDAAGELSDRVFRLDLVFSDGASTDANLAVVRFPANTFGVRQCVYAMWTARGFDVQSASGARCTTFMG